MLPRNEAEIARKKLCAFINFECFSAAYLAKKNLNEKKIFEQNIKIVWSKNLAAVAKQERWLEDYKGVNDPQVEIEYIEE